MDEIRDKLHRLIRQKINRAYLLLFLVLITGVVTQNIVLFRGGWKTPEGLIFPSLHDTMWNIAIASELFHHFPPENPAIAGVILKNNHYFYPFFLSILHYLTGINIFDLYFRFGPLLVSVLFGLGIYSISTIFTKNIFFKSLTIFLGYFSGNFAYLLPAILGPNFDWKGNTFFADQPFDQIINPYSVFGFTLMMFGIYCLSKIAKGKGNVSVGLSIIASFLFGIIYGFKSFGGVIMISALLITFFLQFFFYRRLSLLLVTFTSIILFAAVLFLTTDFKNASLIWAPGWLLTQMMTDKDKLNLPQFADLESFYKLSGKLPGFLKIKFIELITYLVGNLGTRILGLAYLCILFVSRRFRSKYIIQFIGISVFISLVIPLLFNLRNSTFNIIQFTPYSLLLLAVISAYTLEKIYFLLKGRKQKLWGIAFIIIFVVASIPVNVKNILSKIEPPKDMITNEEIAALNYLRKETKQTALVLIDPKEFSSDPIYIPAISERRVYLSSPSYAAQTGIDPKEQLFAVDQFFQAPGVEFLKKNHIGYIYVLKGKKNDSVLKKLEKTGLMRAFENEQVIIWKTE